MREILFRGKRLDNGNWVTSGSFGRMGDDGINWDYFIGASKPAIHIVNSDGNILESKTLDECLFYMVDPKTVGQFTGLTDKNGTKIFEGDIIRALVNEVEESSELIDFGIADKIVKVPTGNKIQAFWSVEWKTFSGSVGWRVYGKDRRFNRPFTPNMIFNCQCEVIGNIHDNPELLEVD